MFHTPPMKTEWVPETSINHSYIDTDDKSNDESLDFNNELHKSVEYSETHILNTEEVNSIIENSRREGKNDREVVEGDETIKGSVDNTSIIESFDVPTIDELPSQLGKLYETFLIELQEPKFDRALASFEISEIFQSFYRKFNDECLEYIKNEKELEMYSLEEGSNQYKSNLIMERLLCNKFYENILFSQKSIEIDELENSMNERFSKKIKLLNFLNFNFKNLDINELPSGIENAFVNELHIQVLPIFELFTAETSPTLKMKYLVKIHKKIGTIIKSLAPENIILNTDIYLPILIFSIIKLEELNSFFLIKQLNLMKRFSNEYIFENSAFEIEKGKLLYVLTNYEASISYLCNVTLENLNLEMNSEDELLISESLKMDVKELQMLLNTPIKLESIDENITNFKKQHPLVEIKNDYNKKGWMVDYNKFTLPTMVIHADEGLSNISEAIDSSLKNIIDKVSWLNFGSPETTGTTNNNEISTSLMKQLEENDILQTKERPLEADVTPISSISNDDEKERTTRSRSGSSAQDRLMRLTNSVSDAMKSFGSNNSAEMTTSSSNTNHFTGNNATGTPIKKRNVSVSSFTGITGGGNNIRSRATSFMSTSFFGGSSGNNNGNNNTHTNNSQSFISLPDTNATGSGYGSPNKAVPGFLHSKTNSLFGSFKIGEEQEDSTHLVKQVQNMKRFDKPFKDMSVAELEDMFSNYQKLVALATGNKNI